MSTLSVASVTARVLRWQSVSVDLDARTVSVDGRPVPASPAEYILLCLLLQRRNIPLGRAVIMAELFGPGHRRDERQADIFVLRLRTALAAAGAGPVIQTVAGRGYAVLDEGRMESCGAAPCDHPVLLAA